MTNQVIEEKLIEEVAKEVGKSERMIRHWLINGLAKSNKDYLHRLSFTQPQIEHLKKIALLQRNGFTVNVIKHVTKKIELDELIKGLK